MTLSFTVYGTAQTAGSKRAFVLPGKNGSKPRAIVTDDNPKGKDWRRNVAESARGVYRGSLLEGALKVTMRFYRPRPAGHFGKNGLSKTGRESPAPIVRPDVLKLARCAEDSLTGIVWRDDAQIVEEHLSKHWGEPARAEIEIEVITEPAETLPTLFAHDDSRPPWESRA